ncbi:MAG: restriction endonuclease [Hydrogenophilales bacterium 17-64-11]|nr:MAG: restriction endonuclease [Hydrogenophilales bacterium 17-64-11]
MSVSLSEHLPLLAEAPDGIKKLRGLIFELAVRGKLVPQDPNDEPASELLKRIAAEKARLVAEGTIRQGKPLAEMDEEEKPFELPVGWEWSPLGAIALINPRNAADDMVEASFVPMAMINTRFEGSHDQESRKWGEIKQGFTHFAEGDIGVAKITPCFENSKACVFSGLRSCIGAGTTELHIVRPISETLAPRYVLAYLKSPMFLQVGESKMTGTAGQKRLPKEFVEANPFPLPPLAEQHRVVAKVDELMALCDRMEAEQADAEAAHATLVQTLLGTLTQSGDAAELAANWQRLSQHFDTLFTTEASLDALKQTILQLAVMGKLVPQDPKDEPASELLNQISAEKARLMAEGKIKQGKPLTPVSDEEKPFEVPVGWKWTRLAELTSILNGRAYSKHELLTSGTPVLRVGNLFTSNHWYYSDLALEDEKYCDTGDLLYSWSASFGPFIWPGPRVIYHYHIWKLGLYDETSLSKEYLYKFLVEKTQEIKASGHGVAMIHMTKEKMEKVVVPIPPLSEQHRIVAKVDELMALCDSLKADLAESRARQARLAATLIESALQAA